MCASRSWIIREKDFPIFSSFKICSAAGMEGNGGGYCRMKSSSTGTSIRELIRFWCQTLPPIGAKNGLDQIAGRGRETFVPKLFLSFKLEFMTRNRPKDLWLIAFWRLDVNFVFLFIHLMLSPVGWSWFSRSGWMTSSSGRVDGLVSWRIVGKRPIV